MAFSNSEQDEVMSSINVTPLTDVLLVLLIIFMITASAIQKERIHIPVTHYKDKANETDTIISIEKTGKIYVGAKEILYEDLASYLAKLVEGLPLDEQGNHPSKVIIKADKDTSYGHVAEVMDAAKSAGLNDISLATKPLDEEKKQDRNEKQ